jgi:RHS repeat-associated protein
VGEREGGYYLLGTITHLKTGSTITEFNYDAWGRRRDKDDWSYTLTSEPALFADRGFTSHEFLADFNLYNMNGRLYDPVVGRFLSPDPYIQTLCLTKIIMSSVIHNLCPDKIEQLQ